MARVPTPQGNVVDLRPVTDAKLVAPDAGQDAIGRGLQQFGRGLSNAADDFDQANKVRDEASTRMVVNHTTSGVDNLLYSGPDAFTLKQNHDAVLAQPAVNKAIADQVSAARAALKGPRQQRLFDLAISQHQVEWNKAINTHTATQERSWDEAETQGTIAQAQTDGARAAIAGDLDGYAKNRQTVLDATTSSFYKKGLAGVPAQVAAAKAVSALNVSIADGLRDKSAPQAEKWLADHATDILPDDMTKAHRDLVPGLEESKLDQAEHLMDDPPAHPVAEVRDHIVATNADPLRGAGHAPVAGGSFGAPRPGGRVHAGEDIPAAIGTPVYPPMSGKVIKAWFDPAGGNSVLIQHPNGKVTGYAHLRNSNVSAGDEVSADTVIGGVGNTGTASRGAHLHYTIRDSVDGPKVNPETANWGEAPLPAYTGQRNDKQALYDHARDVATAMNLNPKEYRGLLARVDQRVAREDNLKARVDKDNTTAALDVVDKLGPNGLVRRDQIPNWSSLSPETRIQLGNQIEANTKEAKPKADGDRALSLNLMAVADKATFTGTDLRLYRQDMTPGEFASLALLQTRMKVAGPGAPEAVSHGRIWGMIDRFDTDVGLKSNLNAKRPADRADRMRTFALIQQDLQRTTEGKRQPTDDEIKSSFDRATIQVKLDGSTVPRYKVPEGGTSQVAIPIDVRNRIVASLRKHGLQPDDQMISRTYVDNKGKPGFWM